MEATVIPQENGAARATFVEQQEIQQPHVSDADEANPPAAGAAAAGAEQQPTLDASSAASHTTTTNTTFSATDPGYLLQQAEHLIDQARQAAAKEHSERLALAHTLEVYRQQIESTCCVCQERRQEIEHLQARVAELESELQEEEQLGKMDREDSVIQQDSLMSELETARAQIYDCEEEIRRLRQKLKEVTTNTTNGNEEEEALFRRRPSPDPESVLQSDAPVVAAAAAAAAAVSGTVRQEDDEEEINVEPETELEPPLLRSPPGEATTMIEPPLLQSRPGEATTMIEPPPPDPPLQPREEPPSDVPITMVPRSDSVDSIYIGSYNENGEREGLGELHWSNGHVYTGSFVDNLCHGLGEIAFATCCPNPHHCGGSFVGEWCQGQMHGTGCRWYTDGAKYVGDYDQGKKQGHGRLQYASGNWYEGGFWNNTMHGAGCFYKPSLGERFVGHFVHGNRTGKGEEHLGDGSLLVFLYVDDHKTGTGVLYSPDRTQTWQIGQPPKAGLPKKKSWRNIWKGHERIGNEGWTKERCRKSKAEKLLRDIEVTSSRMIPSLLIPVTAVSAQVQQVPQQEVQPPVQPPVQPVVVRPVIVTPPARQEEEEEEKQEDNRPDGGHQDTGGSSEGAGSTDFGVASADSTRKAGEDDDHMVHSA